MISVRDKDVTADHGGGGGPFRRRSVPVWCQCRGCKDQITVTLWVRPSAVEGVLSAWLEGTADARVEDGLLYHRCGAILQAFDLPGRCVLEPMIL